jgi:AAHS family 4-hydroxybenzoate transporter-like MFS transporter
VRGEQRAPLSPSALQARVILLVLALFFVDGIDVQMLAVALPALIAEWTVPASKFALALAIGHVGAAIGASIGGVLGDRIGRKSTIIGGALLFGITSVSLVLITNVSELVLLRFISGLGLGGCIPPAIALLTERFSARRRGTVVGLALLCTPFGIAAVGLLAAIVIPAHGWRTLFVIAGALPVGLALTMMPLLPESSAHARSNGRRSGIYREIRSLGLAYSASFLCFSFALSYLALSIVLTWLPTLLSREGFSMRIAAAALSVWSIGGMTGTLLAGWAVGRLGWLRTTMGLAACAAGGALLLALSASVSSGRSGETIALYCLLAVTGCMVSGLITSLFAAATYIFPLTVRSTGIGGATTAGRIGAISGALWGVQAIKLDGPAGFFIALAGVLLMAVAGLWMTGRAYAAQQRVAKSAD